MVPTPPPFCYQLHFISANKLNRAYFTWWLCIYCQIHIETIFFSTSISHIWSQNQISFLSTTSCYVENHWNMSINIAHNRATKWYYKYTYYRFYVNFALEFACRAFLLPKYWLRLKKLSHWFLYSLKWVLTTFL